MKVQFPKRVEKIRADVNARINRQALTLKAQDEKIERLIDQIGSLETSLDMAETRVTDELSSFRTHVDDLEREVRHEVHDCQTRIENLEMKSDPDSDDDPNQKISALIDELRDIGGNLEDGFSSLKYVG